MDIEEIHCERAVIEGMDEQGIVIDGQHYQRVTVSADGAISVPDETSWQDLTADSFQAAQQAGAEVVLLGTGSKQQFAHPKIMAALAAQGIGLECMTTAAACRTFTLLQSEGRKVWAWLWL